jgi:hypothetical protein
MPDAKQYASVPRSRAARFFQGAPRRVLGAGVFKAFVLADALLNS